MAILPAWTGLQPEALSSAFRAIAVPYFVHSRYQYLLSPLPTFWIGKAAEENAPIYLLLSFVLASLWIFFLTRKFSHKII